MKYTNRREALLLLEDGTLYRGFALGKTGTMGGELCFNTGMTGYQEIYTDPSYYGQIIVNTTSHIGNYGTVPSDQESSKVKISGLVCNYFSQIYSRNTAEQSLQEYLERAGIVGIHGVDTRQIVKHIRNRGAMNAIISSEILDEAELTTRLREVPPMDGLELSSEVSTKVPYVLGAEDTDLRIAVLDLGIKKSILSNFTARGGQFKVFPAHTTFREMEGWKPSGYFISNGPGDPAAMPYAIQTVRDILAADKPLFGICLGHQLLAQASGIPTFKMHNGHRGLNHPVKNLLTGKGEITSQNHGFGVNGDAVKDSANVQVTHLNLNDNSVEGIRRKGQAGVLGAVPPRIFPGAARFPLPVRPVHPDDPGRKAGIRRSCFV
jgi:carbamoyl-phosphate synthase small subunit